MFNVFVVVKFGSLSRRVCPKYRPQSTHKIPQDSPKIPRDASTKKIDCQAQKRLIVKHKKD
jgi:hypothetical protein